ncbi:MAG: chromosome segregation protein SMC [Elusimicrobiota bacterium]
MYLKSLELCGFKSFPDKTVLEFTPGISAIAGPNGCGKSNIVDAFRWVLGEQSANALRGKDMEALIFHGSDTRHPVSFAEVSLTFDNNEHKVPINFTEIKITRRLYRSGESEYTLNKTQCRLKDIRDLLLDTGVGTDSYSLMEQGKVDYILKSKPEERRLLIEEAGGIAKYRVKREETLRKLEHVDADLLRLDDILSMLKTQIQSLDNQARKAKLYNTAKESLKYWEVALFSNKYNEHNGKKQLLEDQQIKFGQELQQYVTEINTFEAEQQKMSVDKQAADDSLSKCLMGLTSLSMEQTKLTASKNNAADKILSGEVKINELNRIVKEASDELGYIIKQIEDHSKQKVVLEEDHTRLTAEHQKQTEVLGWTTRQVNTTSGELRKQEELQLASVQQITGLRNDIYHYQSDLQAINIEKNNIEKDFQQAAARKNDYTAKLTELNSRIGLIDSELEKLGSRLNQWDVILTSSQQMLELIKADIEQYRHQITSLTAQADVFTQWQEEQLTQRAGAKVLVDNPQPGIDGPLMNLMKAPKETEKLLETVLGEKMYYFIAENQEAAKAAAEYLSNSATEGWAAFILLDRLEKINIFSNIFDNSLAKNIKCDNKYLPVLKYLLGTHFKVEQAAGTLVENGPILYGGTLPKDTGALSIARQIEEAKLLNEQHTAAITVLEIRQGIVETDISVFNDLLHQTRVEINKINSDRMVLVSEKATISGELEYLGKELDVFSKEILQSEEKQRNAVKLLGTNTEKIDTLKVEEQALTKIVSELKIKLDSLKTDELTLLRETGEINASLVANNERRQRWSNEQQFHQQEHQRVRQSIERANTEINGQQLIIEESKKVVAENEVAIVEVDKQMAVIQESIASARETVNQMYNKMQENESKLRGLRHERERLQKELHSVDVNASYTKGEVTHIVNELSEKYNLTPETCTAYFQPIMPKDGQPLYLDEITGTVEKLRKRVDSFGNVNLAAPEEYENLNSRYTFLEAQRQDLVKAKSDLQEIIFKINTTTKEKFKETFDSVRGHFVNIYRTLFEGGEADLVLTNEENLLETGIEIKACPPGKKVKEVVSLSGGESSLTAIALMFGLFMVKPAPFCIMDEADSALDESNTLRFMNLLREYAKTSQFIIITHNKKTMEAADIYYGVTSEEVGVTKIISVKFVSTNKQKMQQMVTEPVTEEPVIEEQQQVVTQEPVQAEQQEQKDPAVASKE